MGDKILDVKKEIKKRLDPACIECYTEAYLKGKNDFKGILIDFFGDLKRKASTADLDSIINYINELAED